MIPSEKPAPPGRGAAGRFGGIDFVVVDVETTGWSPAASRVTEIGAVRVSEGRARATFSSLVNPGQPVPPTIAALTGISDATVAQAPPIGEVLPSFLAFAHGGVLAAHNAPFDIGFLTAACSACGLRWPAFDVVDTVELARRVLAAAEVPDLKLATLARHFGARTPPRHRALSDALATADVLEKLLARLAAGTGGLREIWA